MQNSVISWTFIFISLFIFSCKNDKSALTDTKPSHEDLLEEGYTLISSEGVSEADIAVYNGNASNILEHRIKNDQNKSWAIIEHGIWEYEFVFTKGEMSKVGEMAGNWIDFTQEATYEYGLREKVIGSGRYHYSPETGLLLLVDSNSGVKPREFKVQIAGDIMVFSGSPEYKDNGMQGKLKKVMQRPS